MRKLVAFGPIFLDRAQPEPRRRPHCMFVAHARTRRGKKRDRRTSDLEGVLRRIFRRIASEHAVIKAELAILTDAATRVLGQDPKGPLALREALWTVYTRLVDHLATEEHDLLPLL